jgi:hypothetical protein
MATVLEGVLPKSGVLFCVFLWVEGVNWKDIHKEMLPVYGVKCLLRKAVHSWVENVSLMTKRLKRRCGNGWDNGQKISVLRVSTHWQSDGTSVSMFVKDMSRNKCFSQVRISHVLLFRFICDLFTDSSSYYHYHNANKFLPSNTVTASVGC